MNALCTILLLLCSAESAEAKAVIKAPDVCATASMLTFDFTESVADSISATLVPSNSNFVIDSSGKKAYFFSVTPGTFYLAVAVAKEKVVDQKVFEVKIIGPGPQPQPQPQPQPNDLDAKIKSWLPATYDPATLKQFANSLDIIIGLIDKKTLTEGQQIIDTLANSNRIIFNPLEPWKPFLDNISKYLQEKETTTPDQFKSVFTDLSSSIRKVAQ